jgi:hypothetical protein|tara:strand:+ start:332 stop:508 length:177 start_codon:yes stop_codon:yes gene_type:complete
VIGKAYKCKVLEDPDNPGELALDIPDELLAEAGWSIGDDLNWIDNEDGSWTIEKITGE